MEVKQNKLRRRTSTTTGGEIVHIHGFSLCKSQQYQFSNSTGDFVYSVGSHVIVYDPVRDAQKEYLKNQKGLPFSSLEFSNDGNDLFIGEYMTKEAHVKHYAVAKNGKYTLKPAVDTRFRSIDGIAVSLTKSMLAMHGNVRNSDNKDLKKLELFDLNTHKSLAIHGLTYKTKNFFFDADNTLFLL